MDAKPPLLQLLAERPRYPEDRGGEDEPTTDRAALLSDFAWGSARGRRLLEGAVRLELRDGESKELPRVPGWGTEGEIQDGRLEAQLAEPFNIRISPISYP